MHMTSEPPSPSYPTRVCLIINRLNPGGSERQVLLLARRLPRSRFRVTIASLYDKGAWNDEARRASDEFATMGRRTRAGLPAAIARLGKFLGDSAFDIVHPFAWPVNAFVPMMRAAFAGAVVGSVRATRMNWKGLRRIVIPSLELRALASCDHVISNSVSGMDHVVRLGLSSDRVSIIENGVDLNALVPARPASEVRKALAVPADTFVVLVIARLEKIKGIDRLIDAAADSAIRDRAHFFVAGDGPEHAALANRVRATGAPVRLLGNRNDLPDLISACDFVCHPSRGESFPNAVVEAMALRRPVVASAVGDTARLVDTGETGILFDSDAKFGLRDALVRMLDSRSHFADWGEAAFQRVMSVCSPDRMVLDHAEIYSRLSVSSRRPSPATQA